MMRQTGNPNAPGFARGRLAGGAEQAYRQALPVLISVGIAVD